MTTFHDKTLALLGGLAPRPQRSVQRLTKWAERNCIQLPGAFAQWAQLDDGSLLEKYSNSDWFWFDEPEVVAIPGGRALRFNSENQNNFDRLVMLDGGDDPPVLFGWVGQPPWVTYTEHFSDAIFAQISIGNIGWSLARETPNKRALHTPAISVCLEAAALTCSGAVMRRRYKLHS